MSDTVSAEMIDQMVLKIVEQFDPVQVILFGSYATGKPTADSDVDLFVVMPFDIPRHKQAAQIRLLFPSALCPIDILVYTPQEVDRWSGVINHIVTDVMATGKILYERSTDRIRSTVA